MQMQTLEGYCRARILFVDRCESLNSPDTIVGGQATFGQEQEQAGRQFGFPPASPIVPSADSLPGIPPARV
jgi:hypothetical protein